MDRLPDLTLTERALDILQIQGLSVDRAIFLDRMRIFYRLCSTWNLAAKLMSKGDLEDRFDEHITDSLSLGQELGQYPTLAYIDVGTGGGFPAIPLTVALEGRSAWLVERSQRKADYLRQAVKALGLSPVQVIEGQFPCSVDAPSGRIYTARAIERPELFDTALIKQLSPGDIYLLQREPAVSLLTEGIKAVPVEDEFTRQGLRRGLLYRVTR